MTPGEAEKMRDIPHSIRVFEISGPLFFAAADEILTITSDKSTKVIVIRMRSVPAIDASAMRSLRDLAARSRAVLNDPSGFLFVSRACSLKIAPIFPAIGLSFSRRCSSLSVNARLPW